MRILIDMNLSPRWVLAFAKDDIEAAIGRRLVHAMQPTPR